MQFALAENKTNKHNNILAFCEFFIKRLLVLRCCCSFLNLKRYEHETETSIVH